MSKPKHIASVSVDLDNHWTYLKTRGDARWQTYPSYLEKVVPRILDFARRQAVTLTFFVVGQDASQAQNRDLFRAIADAGHEVSNHSFRHEPWLHLYSPDELRREIRAAEEAIEGATGVKPVGFRGPGYSYSKDSLQALVELGYEYDASTLPTFLGPLARLYYFMASGLKGKERHQRDLLFGSWRNGLLPLSPYVWRGAASDLIEIPVTTMPGIRTPIHPSYILFACGKSDRAGKAYFQTALRACELTRTPVSLLLHPLDFLGDDDRLLDLAFFPAMDLPRERKAEILEFIFAALQKRFEPVTMRKHARIAHGTGLLPVNELVRLA